MEKREETDCRVAPNICHGCIMNKDYHEVIHSSTHPRRREEGQKRRSKSRGEERGGEENKPSRTNEAEARSSAENLSRNRLSPNFQDSRPVRCRSYQTFSFSCINFSLLLSFLLLFLPICTLYSPLVRVILSEMTTRRVLH